ncbi:hypothetical protein FSP39_016479 [Pinctada imbricata]|uniref:ENT domain-containing protein n=1 Tax=Pinctada imbricata TaxID=66713 RepID=A0AA89BTT6_PINIB|nr:hypothetical protein FSP39_016479 [Pinctada imbricata]
MQQQRKKVRKTENGTDRRTDRQTERKLRVPFGVASRGLMSSFNRRNTGFNILRALMMWPMLLDMGKEDCKRVLRRMELEAYCSIISAYRAQGDLTKDKKKILQDLQQSLSISTERHRAEVRRAVNDEKLSTIAYHMSGPNTDSEWMIEGRRLIPLMPRLVPQTAFTVTANQVANMQAERNASMPSPSLTANKDLNSMASSPTTPVSGTVTKLTRPASPNSNVVVLPSGMSIHIKGGLNTEEDEDLPVRKRRRSQSTESVSVVSPSASTQTPRVTLVSTPSNIPGMSPMKITISKSPQGRPHTNTTVAQSQKVILVSSSGQASSSSILQKSITVPVVKTSSSLSGLTNQNKASIILSNSGNTSNGSLGNIVTVTTPTLSSTATSSSFTTTATTFLTPTVSIQKPRAKTLTRHRIPQTMQGQQKPGVVIPMGPQPVHPSPQSMQNVHVKPASKTSTIQIRQEGGMKIITQSYPGGSGSKILPKPLQTGSGTPVVVVSGSSASSSSSNVTMVSRPLSSVGTKILNITQGGKVIQGSLGGRGSNVVTVNPKTLHLTAVKSSGGGSGKPNVIVVQKTQPRRSSIAGSSVGGTVRGSNILTTLDKKQELKHIVVQNPSGQQRPVERKVIVTTPGQLEATRQKIRLEGLEGKQGTFLHELIQAASQQQQAESQEGTGDVTINLDESTLAALTATTNVTEPVQAKASTSASLPNNEWFEYDVADDGNQSFHSSSLDSASLQAFMEQSGNKPKVTVQRSASVDISQLQDQLSSQQFYTIEQAMKILNNPERAEAAAAAESLLVSDDSQDSNTVTSVEPNVHVEVQPTNPHSTHSELEQIARNLNLQGELDPQTGIFYTVTNAQGQTETRRMTADESHVTVESSTGDTNPTSRTYDLLSSSLAQAQIDLEPYHQFIEEDVHVLPEKSISDSETKTITITDASTHRTEHDLTGPTTIRLKPGSSFIPIQDLSGQTSTINITKREASPIVSIPQVSQPQDQEFTVTTGEEVPTTDFLSNPASLTDEVQVVLDPGGIQTTAGGAVTVETTPTVDPVEMGLDEYVVIDNPQPGTSSSSESQSEYIITTDATGAAKLIGKRKRKVGGINIEDSPTGVHSSWMRACLGLIQKVMKYRGLNRDKGDLNASFWFLEPVDPADAPDYYNVIDNPMDFGTIKRKLELGSYEDYEDFTLTCYWYEITVGYITPRGV